MNKSVVFLFILIIAFQPGKAQTGGENIYEFLNIGSSARVVALGGDQVALNNTSADYAFYNPAALNPKLDQEIALNYVSYLAGINYGYASYTKDFKAIGTFSIGLHYVNYGKFIQADEFGAITGDFKAADYALLVGYGREINKNLRIGASIKPIYSSLEKYNSLGIASDISLIYNSSDERFRASIIARNFGYQIKTYYNSHREDLPSEVLIGMSTKLQHAPFCFALTYRHLEKFDLSYESELDNNNFDNTSTKDQFTDKMLKHLILGVEFLPSQNFSLRLGYNFQRRAELKLAEKTSTVGFSWGFGFNVSRFRISYASAKYHLAGSSNLFSISTRLSDFRFK